MKHEVHQRLLLCVKNGHDGVGAVMVAKLTPIGCVKEHWLLKAANYGNVYSMMWLSQIYDKGLFGIKRNQKAAYKLHLRAATKGYPLARTMLSIKAEKNGQFQEALMLYNLACSGECSPALKALIVKL